MKPIKIVNNIRTYLSAKIITYYLNALADAQISQQIINYLQKKPFNKSPKNSIWQDRAKKLIQSNKPKTQIYLAAMAYTLYYANGAADYLYAKLITKIFIHHQKTLKIIKQIVTKYQKKISTHHLYQEFNSNKYLFLYWPLVIFKPSRWFNTYLITRKLKIVQKHTANQIADLNQAIHQVQKQNLANNAVVAKLLLNNHKTTIPKVMLLRQTAANFSNSQLFLKSAAHTQLAAAKWDKLFSLLIGKKTN